MWKFFTQKKYLFWSWGVGLSIIAATWYKITLDKEINDWFGTFYDTVQKALSNPGSVSLPEFYGLLFTFFAVAGIYVIVAVIVDFVAKHYAFRWRTSMDEYFTANWGKLRSIEGSSQRIQEDLFRFSRTVQDLGINLIRSLMTLGVFLPILWDLSKHITVLPVVGQVDHSLIYVAVLFALAGTLGLALVGVKLPGLEFDQQVQEAKYRKELVYGEDDASRADAPTLKELYEGVRKNQFKLYFHYMYFDVAKWSYLQGGVLVPYVALAPTIVAGTITLGVMQQIVRAFGKVENSLQFLVNSWSTIVELQSIHKRIRAFEKELAK